MASDTLFPEAWALWQKRQPSATFVEMSGANPDTALGHMLTLEAPEDVAAVVLHWLEHQGVIDNDG
jgi:hypothetical protein